MTLAALGDLDRAVNGGPRRFAPRPVACRALVQAAVERWRGVAAASHRSLVLRWRAGAALVMADPERVGQALDNLIHNAILHGGLRVRVEASVVRGRREDLGRRQRHPMRAPGRRARPAAWSRAPRGLRDRRRARRPLPAAHRAHRHHGDPRASVRPAAGRRLGRAARRASRRRPRSCPIVVRERSGRSPSPRVSRRARAIGFGCAALACAGLAAAVAGGYRTDLESQLGPLRPAVVAREPIPATSAARAGRRRPPAGGAPHPGAVRARRRPVSSRAGDRPRAGGDDPGGRLCAGRRSFGSARERRRHHRGPRLAAGREPVADLGHRRRRRWRRPARPAGHPGRRDRHHRARARRRTRAHATSRPRTSSWSR